MWPFPWAPLSCRVDLCSLTSSVRAARSDSSWTPQLLPGTPALQVLPHWQLSLLGRGCARHWALLPEHSVRWETGFVAACLSTNSIYTYKSINLFNSKQHKENKMKENVRWWAFLCIRKCQRFFVLVNHRSISEYGSRTSSQKCSRRKCM